MLRKRCVCITNTYGRRRIVTNPFSFYGGLDTEGEYDKTLPGMSTL